MTRRRPHRTPLLIRSRPEPRTCAVVAELSAYRPAAYRPAARCL
jgi:hypothetical protein